MASMTNKGVSLELNNYVSNRSIVVSIPDSLTRCVHGHFRLDPPDSQLHSLQLFRPCRFHLRQHHQHARQNHLQVILLHFIYHEVGKSEDFLMIQSLRVRSY